MRSTLGLFLCKYAGPSVCSVACCYTRQLSHNEVAKMCLCVQSLALAHANVDNDLVFLDKW